MSQVLPHVFIGLSGLVLILAIYSFWQSVRGLLLAPSRGSATSTRSEARMLLIDEKASLLKALKEIKFERDLGKISDQDYEALNTRYRARAKEVMRELDLQLGPFQQQAQKLVAKRLQTGEAPAGGDVESVAKQPSPTGGDTAGVTASVGDKVAEQASDNAPAGPAKKSAVVDAQPGPECLSCGAANEADALFCKKCGHKLAGDAP